MYLDYKPSLKGALLCHVTHFKFGAPSICQKWLKLELSNFVHRWAMSSLTKIIKRAWLWSRDLFKLLVPSYNISRTAKARDFKFCTVVCQVVVQHQDYKLSLEWVWSLLRDVFKLSETVQDRVIHVVTMEDKQEVIYGLSNGMIADDLE